MEYDRAAYNERFREFLKEKRITRSDASFKIRLFLEKADNSLLISRFHKDIRPSKDNPPKLHWNYWAITIAYYAMLYAAKAAIISKGYEAKDHIAAQIALGHLLVPDKMEKEDLELLDQAHKIFEDEYFKYFDDARAESHTARYSAIKTYTERRVEEIFRNAQKFIGKIRMMLE